MGRQPTITSGLRAQFVADHYLAFSMAVNDTLIRHWMGVVSPGLGPRALGRELFGVDGHTHRLTVAEVCPDNVVVEARGARILVGHRGNSISFESARTLDRKEAWIHMDFTHVATALQGRGIGTILAGNCYRVARALGFSHLGVTAVDHGTCVWAHAGFIPTHESWNKDGGVKSCIASRLAALHGSIPWETANLVYGLLSADDPRMIWAVSDLTEKVPSRYDPTPPVPLGWALLAESGATWKGTLPFADTAADLRARDYLKIGS